MAMKNMESVAAASQVFDEQIQSQQFLSQHPLYHRHTASSTKSKHSTYSTVPKVTLLLFPII